MSATLQTSLKEKLCESVEIPIFTRCCFCFPLRKGLITFAYFNTIVTIAATILTSVNISTIRSSETSDGTEMTRLIIDTASFVLEIVMSVLFIVALHLKHVLTMKIYLYFEVVFSIIVFIYSVVFMNRESGEELFLILFVVVLQIYIGLLIWSSITKMKRDGTVKYTRDADTV